MKKKKKNANKLLWHFFVYFCYANDYCFKWVRSFETNKNGSS